MSQAVDKAQSFKVSVIVPIYNTVKLKTNQTSYKKPSLLRRIARKLLK